MRLNAVLGGVALAALLAFAGAAEAKNTLRWASQGDALTLDPHAQNEGPTNAMSEEIHEPLVKRDKDLKKEPALAVSWKPLEGDGWEFKLRQGVKFHDGSPFTADDVVFSINRALAPTSDFKNYIGNVAAVQKVDEQTVHIMTKGPNPILPDQLTSIVMMSKAWAEKHGVQQPQDYKNKQETYAVRNANGTGPWKVQLREPGVRTVLVKNPDWWGAKQWPTNVDEIVYTPIANPATRVAALLSGELDFLLDPPVQDIERVKQAPGLSVQQIHQIRSIFLGMQVAKPELATSNAKGKNPFAEKAVRQAMYQAIDIDAIHKKVMRGASVPAGLITSPGVHGYTKELDRRLPYDPEAAKKLMAQAGYPEGFEVKLDCPNDRYVNDEGICQAVVGMLGRIGVKVALDAQSKTLHFPKIQKRETEFYLLGWGVPTLDSHYVFSYLYHTKGSWNATGYSNAKVDELTEKMEREIDLKKRDAMIEEAWRTVRDDVVYLPLHHQVITWAMSSKLELPIVANDSPQFRYAMLKR
jgi:peptide/nickel transport system substrate-binding protein